MKYIIILSICFNFIACVSTSNRGIKAISESYIQEKEVYQKKSKSAFFKNLLGYDSGICPQTEADWKKKALKFYPIVSLKIRNPKSINWDTLSFNGFLNHLEIDRGIKVGAFVSLNDSLCGKSYPFAYEKGQEFISNICCPEAYNLCIASSEKAEFKVVREFNPDVIFNIKDTYFDFGMIKNGQVYFTKFHNGDFGVKTVSEYIQDYEIKYKRSWQSSIAKNKLGIIKN